MKFSMTFECDNAAFEDDLSLEAILVISQVVDKIKSGRSYGPCFDSNGNKVGSWYLGEPPASKDDLMD